MRIQRIIFLNEHYFYRNEKLREKIVEIGIHIFWMFKSLLLYKDFDLIYYVDINFFFIYLNKKN